MTAARALGAATLAAEQRRRVIELVATAGALELPGLIGLFDRAADADEGRALFAALEKSPGSDTLTLARVEALLGGYPPEVRAAADGLLGRLHAAVQEQQHRLVALDAKLGKGDASRGRELFFGARATCGACHQVGTDGGQIGPNLSHIGEVRSRRDLLEAIVFPSASFARGYEPVSIVTTSGRVFSGIVARETPASVYLRTADRAEVRIGREEIDALSPSKTSIMPQGLDRQLDPDQLSDVIAFLQGLK
jgi:putative heme-binding domain-containing protein